VKVLAEESPSPADEYGVRLNALEEFAARMTGAVELGRLVWSEPSNLRALTINNCFRRQRDALAGTIALGKAGQGHLAVAFVRAFFEERLWMTFLADMSEASANTLLLAFGRWDIVRSLVAQRHYIGDEGMTLHLWYPPGFVDTQADQLPAIKADLARLRERWGWQGVLPSTAWVADKVFLRDEHDYLHSATSRALHFSAGEVLRRGWGTPGGVLITDKPEFRGHLADFAYDQLWRQHLGTLQGAREILSDGRITTPEGFFSCEYQEGLTSKLRSLGRVPMVHAYEWNLTPPPWGTRLAWGVALEASKDSGPDRPG
jgi:hypothetical protein